MTMQNVHINDGRWPATPVACFRCWSILFPVSFRGESPGGDALLGRICSTVVADAPDGFPVEWPTLVIPATTQNSGDASMVCTSIQFADDPEVPWPYRGRLIAVRAELDASVSTVGPRQDIPRRWGRKTNLDLRRSPRRARVPYIASSAIHRWATTSASPLARSDSFRYCRCFTSCGKWWDLKGSRTRLRAAFIIDDPNLHWPSYGYADYSSIAASARRDRSASPYDIPLDA